MSKKIKPLSLLVKDFKKAENKLKIKYLKVFFNSIKKTLNIIKAKAVTRAPVKTGLLRSSITYAIRGKGNSNINIKIGSDLNYAMIQEMKHKSRKGYLSGPINEEFFSGKFIEMLEDDLNKLLNNKLKGSNKNKIKEKIKN